jgi:ligand-binding sensor domain-containing protein
MAFEASGGSRGDQHLPSSYIMSMLAARDGTLWIGTLKGLASWKEGKLTVYPELADRYIYKILQDRDGSIWASGWGITTGKLCAIRNGSVQCYGDDGALGRVAFNLYEDSKGNLWAVCMFNVTFDARITTQQMLAPVRSKAAQSKEGAR